MNGIKLTSGELMDRILESLDQKKPLSVVSVGATESFVMAQYTVLSEEEFMNHPEAKIANQGVKSGFLHRGVRFPNVNLRDEVVQAVREADIIGFNTLVSFADAGELTKRVMKTYAIEPKYYYDSYLRRVFMFSQKEKFEKMLRNRRILLIGSPADDAKRVMNDTLKDKLGFEIVGTIKIDEYEEIPQAKDQIDNYQFDLCLIAAGTNALILASYIAKKHGKVAFDIGSGMNSLHTGEVYMDYWLEHIIGLDNLMKM
ncbi:GT-D fold domain-containing glycosyltransferase [Neobacillus cucumis]|uniref:GT-D fold domain-containing glycosyltransferase n=1 Tax=Neobacillus cucumis TaxID=1740721 RepID=UPI002E211369|nr:GT-D fold domain-containing glycosyltransferase [Neobacillus cucumis]